MRTLIILLFTISIYSQNSMTINNVSYEVVDTEFNYVFGNDVPFHISLWDKDHIFVTTAYNRVELIRNHPLGLGSERNQNPEFHFVDNMGPGSHNPTHVYEAINPNGTPVIVPIRNVLTLTMHWQWPNPGRTAQGIETNDNPRRFGLRFFKENN